MTMPTPSQLPPIVIVTGTDTGVGKTVVTSALVTHWGEGRRVCVYKPVQTGVGVGQVGDIDVIRRLSGLHEVHEGARVAPAMAPSTAARITNTPIPSIGEHAAQIDQLAMDNDLVLVEGSGGLMVGLDANSSNLIDLARRLDELDRPTGFIVVARPGLGTLNHTKLTVDAIRFHGRRPLGVIIGSLPPHPDDVVLCNLEELADLTGVPLLGAVPEGIH